MKIKNLLILGLVLVGFTYCSSDDVLDGPTPGSDETADNLKMEIAIKMPAGANTRSSTDGEGAKATGVEAGSDDENKPNSVLIVLVKKGTTNIAGIYDSSIDNSSNTVGSDVSGATFFTTAQFKMAALSAGAEFDVYAFVNPYNGLLDNYPVGDSQFSNVAEFKTNGKVQGGATAPANVADLIKTVTHDGTKANFFMSNAEKVQTVKVEATHIQGAPLKVGINVQRAVARMDYVDRTTIPSGETAKTYTIPNSATIGTHNVSVTFENFKPMNVSKSFFDLKRVAEYAEKVKGDDKIGGAETAANYVVDTDWAAKVAATGWGDLFHSTFKTATTDALVKANYVSMAEAKSSKFYVSENTLPLAENNKKGIATAVVFKGYLTFDDIYIKDGDVSGMVYVWNNKFYGSFDNLPAGIQAIGNTNTGNLEKAGVIGYAKVGTGDDAKYPIYYVYYNVHNQHATDSKSEVGPMEFGVVRNNIYKLTINNLSKFGHPNDPEDKNPKNPDPNPEKAEDPIKSSDLYMQVTATVLDWTVRENSIEF